MRTWQSTMILFQLLQKWRGFDYGCSTCRKHDKPMRPHPPCVSIGDVRKDSGLRDNEADLSTSPPHTWTFKLPHIDLQYCIKSNKNWIQIHAYKEYAHHAAHGLRSYITTSYLRTQFTKMNASLCWFLWAASGALCSLPLNRAQCNIQAIRKKICLENGMVQERKWGSYWFVWRGHRRTSWMPKLAEQADDHER